jgi:hypothetical protein
MTHDTASLVDVSQALGAIEPFSGPLVRLGHLAVEVARAKAERGAFLELRAEGRETSNEMIRCSTGMVAEWLKHRKDQHHFECDVDYSRSLGSHLSESARLRIKAHSY